MSRCHGMLVSGAVKNFEPYNKDFANEPHNNNEP